MNNALAETDLTVTGLAMKKIGELVGQVEDNIEGIRVYATPGGCSGVSFGMTFAERLENGDLSRDCDGFKIVVDGGSIEHLRGAEVDFVEREDGNSTFVFNNIPQPAGAGCGTCGSQGGGCG